jgi:hypothetical protein
MASITSWRIYCNTESDWSAGESDTSLGPPTTCYNNAEHEINPDSVQEESVTYIYPSDNPTHGSLVSFGGVGIAKNCSIGWSADIYGKNTGGSYTIPQLNCKSMTFNEEESTSGSVATLYFNKISSSVLTATNQCTFGNASTLFIEGAPSAGSNVTVTNGYALHVGGNTLFEGSVTLPPNTFKYAILRDEKSSGTHAGTFSSGSWQTRTLNTTSLDSGCGVTLSSNQITITPGTYIISIRAPAYGVDNNAIRLYNITDSSTTFNGSSASAAEFNSSDSVINEKLIVTSTTVYEVQHQCSTSRTNTGLGCASGFQIEVYTTVNIQRL